MTGNTNQRDDGPGDLAFLGLYDPDLQTAMPACAHAVVPRSASAAGARPSAASRAGVSRSGSLSAGHRRGSLRCVSVRGAEPGRAPLSILKSGARREAAALIA